MSDMIHHWMKQGDNTLQQIFAPGHYKRMNEEPSVDSPEGPTYGDITQEAAAEPYLRRSRKGTDTRLTANRMPTKVKNKAYGTVGG